MWRDQRDATVTSPAATSLGPRLNPQGEHPAGCQLRGVSSGGHRQVRRARLDRIAPRATQPAPAHRAALFFAGALLIAVGGACARHWRWRDRTAANRCMQGMAKCDVGVEGNARRDLARAIKLGGIAPPVATVGRAHAKTKTSDEYMFGCSCHLWGSQ
jgi:hypothetical protein